MTTYVQVLAVDTASSSPAIAFFTDNARFLFDCGEGLQRLCVEHRMRISKLDSVFLTRLCPETIGGLAGLCLTAADSGRAALNITGPQGTIAFWNATNYFMRRPNFDVEIRDITSSSYVYQHLELEVTAIPVEGSSVCYICRTPDLPGKFDISKALALRIPKGPLYAMLKRGEAVTLADGRVIQPEEVVDPTILGRYTAIIGNLGESTDSVTLGTFLNSYHLHESFERYWH